MVNQLYPWAISANRQSLPEGVRDPFEKGAIGAAIWSVMFWLFLLIFCLGKSGFGWWLSPKNIEWHLIRWAICRSVPMMILQLTDWSPILLPTQIFISAFPMVLFLFYIFSVRCSFLLVNSQTSWHCNPQHINFCCRKKTHNFFGLSFSRVKSSPCWPSSIFSRYRVKLPRQFGWPRMVATAVFFLSFVSFRRCTKLATYFNMHAGSHHRKKMCRWDLTPGIRNPSGSGPGTALQKAVRTV